MAQEVSVGPNGGVVLGEQGHASFTILNEGALEVQYSISAHDPQVRPMVDIAYCTANGTPGICTASGRGFYIVAYM